MKIVFATHNLHKFEEAKLIFLKECPEIELISLRELDIDKKIEEPIEDGSSFLENALIKAKYYNLKLNLPVISDDSGLVVDELNGAPGIFSARYSVGTSFEQEKIDKGNINKLLHEMKNVANRKAHFACSMYFYDGNNSINSYGEVNGEIDYFEKGKDGFGYDPIFIVDKYGLTFGELDPSIKNTISHRANAIKEMAKKLKILFNSQLKNPK